MTIFCEIVCHETLVKKASHFVAEVMSTDFKAPIKSTTQNNAWFTEMTKGAKPKG